MSPNQSKNKSETPQRLDADHAFRFNCAPGVTCFTRCCRDVTIVLTPYDVMRLKNATGLSSDEFLDKHTLIIRKENLLIPMVVLKMEGDNKKCTFVKDQGCTVYDDRPWPCRMYPLNMNDDGTFSVMADADLCMGLKEDKHGRISDWLLEQGVPIYDEMNQLFSQVTTPMKAQDLDIENPQIKQMIFMALYNLDKFREFVFKSSFLDRFEIDKVQIEKIKRNDVDLLKFSFDWIKFGIFGQKLFKVKQDQVSKAQKENK